MIFVGPTAETLDRFGDKASAKDAAIAAGVEITRAHGQPMSSIASPLYIHSPQS